MLSGLQSLGLFWLENRCQKNACFAVQPRRKKRGNANSLIDFSSDWVCQRVGKDRWTAREKEDRVIHTTVRRICAESPEYHWLGCLTPVFDPRAESRASFVVFWSQSTADLSVVRTLSAPYCIYIKPVKLWFQYGICCTDRERGTVGFLFFCFLFEELKSNVV